MVEKSVIPVDWLDTLTEDVNKGSGQPGWPIVNPRWQSLYMIRVSFSDFWMGGEFSQPSGGGISPPSGGGKFSHGGGKVVHEIHVILRK